jgi:hypothetical protein
VRAAGRSAVALLATLVIAVGLARPAQAGDDDDDDSHGDSGQISVESWPPTEVGWPPLAVLESDDGGATPAVVPAP